MPPPNNVKFDAFLTSGEAADYTESSKSAYRMVLMSDFGGTSRTGKFQPLRIDRDNFDALPGQWGVTLVLPGLQAGGDLSIPIREVDDFDADRLLQSVPAFEDLRQLRKRLGHPTTFAKAAEEVLGWSGQAKLPDAPKVEAPKTGADVLAGILGEPLEPIRDARSVIESEWSSFLRRTVSQHVIPAADPRQVDLENRVDAVIAGLLRAILHHPRFQAIEAAWRGLGLLIKRLETDEAVHLFAVDITRDELAQDLVAADSTIIRNVKKSVSDGPKWSLFLGNYEFETTIADVKLLSMIGQVVSLGGARFIAGATPEHVGCASFVKQPDPDHWTGTIIPEAEAAWTTLRARPEATYLGLVAPRFLLRSAYGRAGREVETMRFEELDGAGAENLLWGNGAFVWATLIGLAVGQYGPKFGNRIDDELGDMPTALIGSDGDREDVPCAEAYLHQATIERIQSRGINVLSSIKNADRVRLMSMASLAERA